MGSQEYKESYGSVILQVIQQILIVDHILALYFFVAPYERDLFAEAHELLFEILAVAMLVLSSRSLLLIGRVVPIEYLKISLPISFLCCHRFRAVVFIRITINIIVSVGPQYLLLWVELLTKSEIAHANAWIVS